MASGDGAHDAELHSNDGEDEFGDGDSLSVVSHPRELWSEAQCSQSNTLLSLDAGLRVRVPLTTMEGDKLKERMGQYFSDGQVALALSCFGHPDGRAATKNLWRKEMEIQQFNWRHNEACSTVLPDFTLAKSLLLSSRAMQGGRPEVTSEAACFCLPRTAIMPAGCYHRQTAVGSTPVSSKKGSPWYCTQCSICLRCNKKLGSTYWVLGHYLCFLIGLHDVQKLIGGPLNI